MHSVGTSNVVQIKRHREDVRDEIVELLLGIDQEGVNQRIH